MKFTTNQMQYFTKFIQVHAIQNIILRIHSSLFMKRVALSYLQGEHGKTSFLSRWSAVHIRGSKKHRLLSCRACLILCITWSEWDIAKNQKSSYNFTKSYTKACNVSKANKVRCHALPKKTVTRNLKSPRQIVCALFSTCSLTHTLRRCRKVWEYLNSYVWKQFTWSRRMQKSAWIPVRS
jgi:hypothetical protein